MRTGLGLQSIRGSGGGSLRNLGAWSNLSITPLGLTGWTGGITGTGNDSTGLITINTTAGNLGGGALFKLNYHVPYANLTVVLINPYDTNAANDIGGGQGATFFGEDTDGSGFTFFVEYSLSIQVSRYQYAVFGRG